MIKLIMCLIAIIMRFYLLVILLATSFYHQVF